MAAVAFTSLPSWEYFEHSFRTSTSFFDAVGPSPPGSGDGREASLAGAYLCLALLTALQCWLLIKAKARGNRALIKRASWMKVCLPEVVLFAAVGWSALIYAREFRSPTVGPILAGFIAGLTAGKALMVLRAWSVSAGRCETLYMVAIPALVGALVFTCLFHPDMGQKVYYHLKVRWTGPLNSPNTFGALMGAGAVLAIGCAVGPARSKPAGTGNGTSNFRLSAILRSATWLAGALVMFAGLVASYSRGAWAGTLCGLGYLAYWVRRRRLLRIGQIGLARMYGVPPLAFVFCSTLLIFIFLASQLHGSEITHRILSLINPNDFSWRNRATAWVGLLQMIGGKPLSGFGWDQFESAYNQLYRPASLCEGGSIWGNDYLALGALLGLPSTVCLLVYIWLQLSGAHANPVQSLCDGAPLAWHAAVCRSASVVLLFAFASESGLLHVPTACVSWPLLALGSEGLRVW